MDLISTNPVPFRAAEAKLRAPAMVLLDFQVLSGRELSHGKARRFQSVEDRACVLRSPSGDRRPRGTRPRKRDLGICTSCPLRLAPPLGPRHHAARGRLTDVPAHSLLAVHALLS